MSATSASTSPIVTPGAMRATETTFRRPRGAAYGSRWSGCHTPISGTMNSNPSASTPTTSYGSPSSVRAVPSGSASGPIRARRYSSLTTATFGPPGATSASVNRRPRTVPAPSVRKKLGVTAPVLTGIDASPVDRLRYPGLNAAHPVSVRLASR